MTTPLTIPVVFNLSDAYAMPATVTIRSAAENLPRPHRLHVFVLEVGVSEQSKRRMEASVAEFEVSFTWIDVRLPSGTFTLGSHPGGHAATYLKLFIGERLPESITKVIYLDSDIVVCSSLLELWSLPLDGHLLAAVADSRWQCERLAKLGIPGANFSEDGAYFNAGMMLIDLAAWRKNRIYERAVESAKQFRSLLFIADQDLLNCVVKGQYKRLDPRWNLLEFYGTAYRKYWADLAPEMYSTEVLNRANETPAIVHYSTVPKPWEGPYAAHDTTLFASYRARTAWDAPSHKTTSPRRGRAYRKTVAIMKAIYRELELGRVRPEIFADLLRHLARERSALLFLPDILLRHGYWGVRAFAVPKLMALRQRGDA